MVKKILAVDDSFEDLTAIKATLSKAGYEVITATNGAQALDILAIEKVSLILIDIKMPTFSGYDLLQIIRAKNNGNIPMIFISIIPKAEANTDQIDGFVQKPFSSQSLITEINRVLKSR